MSAKTKEQKNKEKEERIAEAKRIEEEALKDQQTALNESNDQSNDQDQDDDQDQGKDMKDETDKGTRFVVAVPFLLLEKDGPRVVAQEGDIVDLDLVGEDYRTSEFGYVL